MYLSQIKEIKKQSAENGIHSPQNQLTSHQQPHQGHGRDGLEDSCQPQQNLKDSQGHKRQPLI